MIIQCDQCSTKFRLDDAKVPDKGVKVRCAKCKSIFLVQKETPAEEPDFDILLSGLGAKAPETAPPLTEQEGTDASKEVLSESQVTEQASEPREETSDGLPAAAADQHAGRDDFGEDFFSFGEEPASSPEPAVEPGEFQYGEMPLDSTEATATTEISGGEKDEFDFGEAPLDEGDAFRSSETETLADAPAEPGEFDFSSFDTGPDETAQSADVETPGATTGEIDKQLFASSETVPPAQAETQGVEWQTEPAVEVGEDYDFSAAPPVQPEESIVPAFGELSPTAEPVAEETPGIGEESATEDSGFTFDAEAPHEPPVTAAIPEQAVVKEAVIPFGSTIQPPEEELPPLAISTRKKGNSIFSVAVTLIAVLVVLTIAGFGFYLIKEGPAAFDKLGLSFLAKWIGMESSDSGNITIMNPQGAFMVNGEAGEIFVVSGEAINNYKEPRASIQVKATVLGPKGEALLQKTAYCGNQLSKEQLTTLPVAKIEEAMGSPFGDALANLGVPPGKGIPFVIVFSKVPKDAGEFSVEAAGSTVAAP